MCLCGQRVRSISSRFVRFTKILILKVGINPLFQPQTAEQIHVSSWQLIIQYILRYPAYLEAVISFCNLKTLLAVLLPKYCHFAH
jgi:hypothetical protein